MSKATITIYENAMVSCTYPHVIEAENIQQAIDRLDTEYDETGVADVNWNYTETKGYSLERMGSDRDLNILDVHTVVVVASNGNPLAVENFLDADKADEFVKKHPKADTRLAHRRILVDG